VFDKTFNDAAIAPGSNPVSTFFADSIGQAQADRSLMPIDNVEEGNANVRDAHASMRSESLASLLTPFFLNLGSRQTYPVLPTLTLQFLLLVEENAPSTSGVLFGQVLGQIPISLTKSVPFEWLTNHQPDRMYVPSSILGSIGVGFFITGALPVPSSHLFRSISIS
jgi:hypothetical protein